jgi:hypothetical protein
MRFMMATNRRTGLDTVHQYHEDEMKEIFGSDLSKIDSTGLLLTQNTLWTDMAFAAKKLQRGHVGQFPVTSR